MRVMGIDFSSHYIDCVTVPYDGGTGAPVWTRFPLTGADAFDRARSVADAMPGRTSVFFDDVIAVGIEHPAGRFGVGPLLRVQGAVLARMPARMLVHPLPPARWRKQTGLPGNASKAHVKVHSMSHLLVHYMFHKDGRNYYTAELPEDWPQDAHDAHLIALATRSLITTEAAA